MDKEFRRKHHRELVINLYHPTNPNSTSLFTCSIFLIENTFTYANDSKECIIYICFVFLMCVWYFVNEWCVVVSSEVLMHVCLTLRQSVSVELNHVDSAGWGNKLQWSDWLHLQALKAGVSGVHWHVWLSMWVQRSSSSGLLSILDFFTKFGLTICLNWNHYFIKFLMQLIVIIIIIICFIRQMLMDYKGDLFWNFIRVMFIPYISFYH